MTRRRAGLVVAVVLVLTLVGLGIWRRQQLVDERDAAQAARTRALATIARTQHVLDDTVRTAGTIEAGNVSIRKEAVDLRAVADGIAVEIRAVARERDDAVLAAYAANGQVGTLRSCLDGINRALNQVSVGDPGSTRTLETVRSACRAVG
jgi:hypothetical protein